MLSSVLPLQGLIKIRGDKCWLDLTCMDFHYEVSMDQAVAEAVRCSQKFLHPSFLWAGAGHQVVYRESPPAGLVPLVIWFPFSAQASL